jgi:hypothetical protein
VLQDVLTDVGLFSGALLGYWWCGIEPGLGNIAWAGRLSIRDRGCRCDWVGQDGVVPFWWGFGLVRRHRRYIAFLPAGLSRDGSCGALLG